MARTAIKIEVSKEGTEALRIVNCISSYNSLHFGGRGGVRDKFIQLFYLQT
jgi:hypothetical protein